MTVFTSPLISRLAALGLLALCLVALWTIGVRPLIERELDHRRQIEDTRFQIARALESLALKQEITDQLSALKSQNDWTPFVLKASSPKRAAAELNRTLKRLAEGDGVTLTSLRDLPAVGSEDWREIGVRVELQSDVLALRDLLHAIESATPLLTIDRLHVQANEPREGRALLTVEFDVTTSMEGR